MNIYCLKKKNDTTIRPAAFRILTDKRRSLDSFGSFSSINSGWLIVTSCGRNVKNCTYLGDVDLSHHNVWSAFRAFTDGRYPSPRSSDLFRTFTKQRPPEKVFMATVQFVSACGHNVINLTYPW
jgi:hypothetical protein